MFTNISTPIKRSVTYIDSNNFKKTIYNINKDKMITRQILEFIKYQLDLDINRNEVKEIEFNLNSENDFTTDIDGCEYRFIREDVIWSTYVEEIKQIAADCYGILAPHWLAINWEETANNCIVYGYGTTFSTYDGGEEECIFGEENYYIFRTN